MSTLFDKIVSMENLIKAYKKTQAGAGKYPAAALRFQKDEVANLLDLQRDLIMGTYEFGEYYSFYVYEPKKRLIHAPPYRSKIVQLAINEQLKPILYPKFITHSYACIDDKGTHRAVDQVQYYMRTAQRLYGTAAYTVNIDISKFFYSINRELLKERLARKIKCDRTLELIFYIIDTSADLSDRGLPLGNTLSQMFANVVMDQVDQYAKRVMGIKHYVRYMDDIIAIAPDKETASRWMNELKWFIEEKVDLQLNPKKSQIFPLAQGCNAYGFKIWPTHKLLRDDSKRRIKQKAKKFPRLLEEGLIAPSKVEQIFNSWLGHASNANSHNFIQQLLHKNNYIYINKSGTIKVKEWIK